jgi:hypothetical protein
MKGGNKGSDEVRRDSSYMIAISKTFSPQGILQDPTKLEIIPISYKCGKSYIDKDSILCNPGLARSRFITDHITGLDSYYVTDSNM